MKVLYHLDYESDMGGWLPIRMAESPLLLTRLYMYLNKCGNLCTLMLTWRVKCYGLERASD